jgi:hypothetical protein
VTAGILLGEKEKCYESGMDDYMPKPIIWSQETTKSGVKKQINFHKQLLHQHNLKTKTVLVYHVTLICFSSKQPFYDNRIEK